MSETNDQITIIGADTRISGEMTFGGATAKILGSCEGKISAKGELQIASGSTCKAEVSAARVAIDGVVEGNITASERVQLNGNAKMKGDLVATTLVVESGAAFNGHVRVGPDAIKGGSAGGSSMAEPKVVTVAQDEKAASRK
ncbi:MAG: polymer-forming cytoskeletal protein [Phycisphaeraceae bacterium]|nr:polymer-forming cytoskeletal protein [Phycisphaeraceae bacterium]